MTVQLPPLKPPLPGLRSANSKLDAIDRLRTNAPAHQRHPQAGPEECLLRTPSGSCLTYPPASPEPGAHRTDSVLWPAINSLAHTVPLRRPRRHRRSALGQGVRALARLLPPASRAMAVPDRVVATSPTQSSGLLWQEPVTNSIAPTPSRRRDSRLARTVPFSVTPVGIASYALGQEVRALARLLPPAPGKVSS